MRNIRYREQTLSSKIWKFLNDSLFKLNLLLTFLGILPLILFIYYNLIYFNAIKVIIGCLVLVTMIKANKSIQGG